MYNILEKIEKSSAFLLAYQIMYMISDDNKKHSEQIKKDSEFYLQYPFLFTEEKAKEMAASLKEIEERLKYYDEHMTMLDAEVEEFRKENGF